MTFCWAFDRAQKHGACPIFCLERHWHCDDVDTSYKGIYSGQRGYVLLGYTLFCCVKL
jgi:hypothetical protein